MFTVLAVLAFVIVLVLGIALVEAFDPMPKAQAWGKAAYAQAVAAAPPVVPVVVVRDDGTRLNLDAYALIGRRWVEQLAEERMAAQRDDGTRSDDTMPEWVEWLDQVNWEKEQAAYRKWLKREKALAKSAAAAEEEAYWEARLRALWLAAAHRHHKQILAEYAAALELTQTDVHQAVQACWIDEQTEAYETREAGRTRRAKNQKQKWAQQKDHTRTLCTPVTHTETRIQPARYDWIIAVRGNLVNPPVYKWGLCPEKRWTLDVTDWLEEEVTYQRPAESHHTKHVNPHKGKVRMSERMGELDSAFGDVWEWEDESAS